MAEPQLQEQFLRCRGNATQLCYTLHLSNTSGQQHAKEMSQLQLLQQLNLFSPLI